MRGKRGLESGKGEDGFEHIVEGLPLGKREEIYFTMKGNNEEMLVNR